jgi:hypothetical protein
MSCKKQKPPKTPKVKSDILERAFPIADVDPTGLVTKTDRTYERTLLVDDPSQPLTIGPDGRRRHRNRLQALAGRLRNGQGLAITVQSEPVPVDTVIETSRADVERAALAAERRDEPALGTALRRFHQGEAQTLRRYASAMAAQHLTYYVTVPWKAGGVMDAASGAVRPSGTRHAKWEEHHKAAKVSRDEANAVASALRGAGMVPRYLDGDSMLGLMRQRLAPGEPIDWDAVQGIPQLPAATTPRVARERRTELLQTIAGDRTLTLPTGTSDVVYSNGARERLFYVENVPDATTAWWLMPLLEVGLPYTLTVHIHATDRDRERFKQRTRYRRQRAAAKTARRRGTDISPEAEDAMVEGHDLDRTLHRSSRAGLYDVSIYYRIREPHGNVQLLDEVSDALLVEFGRETDAKLRSPRDLQRTLWGGLGVGSTDLLRATRRYESKNIADVMPLVGASAGTKGGVPVAWAAIGRTLERLDPYDDKFGTSVGLVTGLSGRGKTLFTGVMHKRWLSRGARGVVIDRSSLEDVQADGSSKTGRTRSHWEPLVSLTPGARIVYMGAKGSATLCPWDVPDVANVAATKVRFLRAFHALLIGQRAAGSQDRILDAYEESLLDAAIERVYKHAATSGERPCEQMLIDQIRARAVETDNENNPHASGVYRMLAERLGPYGEGGTYSHIAHDPTNIALDSPLVVYDLGGVSDDLAGPVMLTIIDRTERDIARLRGRIVRGEEPPGGSWSDKFFVTVDETWAQLKNDAAGSWLNEWARRVRHMNTALTAISQHLSDFHNESGRALLRQAVWKMAFQCDKDELNGVAADLSLVPEEVDTVANLRTEPGEYAMAYFVNDVGRGQVRITFAELEYWTCSAHPRRDQPLRDAALRDADGDAWHALRFLIDPEWHQRRTTAALAAADNDAVAA